MGGDSPQSAVWVPLFNGKDFAGWASTAGTVSKWRADGGTITSTDPTDYLFTERSDDDDFHLRAEVKINDRGNSGIYFRSFKPVVGDGTTNGYFEAQISTRDDQLKTGSLFAFVKVDEVLVPPDTWFTYEVIAQGSRIQLLVHGKPTADSSEKKPGARTFEDALGVGQSLHRAIA